MHLAHGWPAQLATTAPGVAVYLGSGGGLTAVVSGLGMLKSGFYLCWLIYIPAPVKDLELNYLFASIHTVALDVLGVMLLMHVSAVIWHYRRGRQAILYRMLPRTAATDPQQA